ncbi:MAG TPA: hypothetical protein VGJ86_03250, partial [Acidimicrobiales bacterium]
MPSNRWHLNFGSCDLSVGGLSVEFGWMLTWGAGFAGDTTLRGMVAERSGLFHRSLNVFGCLP